MSELHSQTPPLGSRSLAGAHPPGDLGVLDKSDDESEKKSPRIVITIWDRVDRETERKKHKDGETERERERERERGRGRETERQRDT